MAIVINGKSYRSKKHPMLEYIFFNKYNPNQPQQEINFTLKDISNGYKSIGIEEPASISNTILDLTRKANDISSRLPESIYRLGYDLIKKTGVSSSGENYAGTFVFVGIGNQIESWLIWPNSMEEFIIDSSSLPNEVRIFLRNDEGSLFSIIDYCNVLSFVFGVEIKRVQNPMKWQPNEIDGFYISDNHGQYTLYPIEAKALTTKDDINLVQLKGGIQTIMSKLNLDRPTRIVPIAIQMINNGMNIAVFKDSWTGESFYTPLLERTMKVKFSPEIVSWK